MCHQVEFYMLQPTTIKLASFVWRLLEAFKIDLLKYFVLFWIKMMMKFFVIFVTILNIWILLLAWLSLNIKLIYVGEKNSTHVALNIYSYNITNCKLWHLVVMLDPMFMFARCSWWSNWTFTSTWSHVNLIPSFLLWVLTFDIKYCL